MTEGWTVVGQVKIDSHGEVVTVVATGYSVIVRGMTDGTEMSVMEAKRLADLLREAASTP